MIGSRTRNTNMTTVPKFRIDVDVHNLLMYSSPGPVLAPVPKGMTLPEPIFPQYPEKLSDPGPATAPQKRDWTLPQVYRKMRGWLFPPRGVICTYFDFRSDHSDAEFVGNFRASRPTCLQASASSSTKFPYHSDPPLEPQRHRNCSPDRDSRGSRRRHYAFDQAQHFHLAC